MFATNKHITHTLLSLAILMMASACSRSTHDHPNLTSGGQLFSHHCETCHASDGTGKLFFSTPANIMTSLNLEQIVHYITTDTHTDREMPVFSDMPKAEAEKIARHLIKLKENYELQSNKQKKTKAFLIEP